MTGRRKQPERPRLPAELSSEALAGDGDSGELILDGVRVEAGPDATPVGARTVEIVDSKLTGATFDDGALRQLLVRDSVLSGCDLSNGMPRKAALRRVELRQARLVGLALGEAELYDVRVSGGTLMLASFGAARLERVVFEEVNLREVSFADAQLDAVAFFRCELAGADFRGARLTNCVMSGSALDGIAGVDSLRGLAMPWPDLVGSSAALAAALGIEVEDD